MSSASAWVSGTRGCTNEHAFDKKDRQERCESSLEGVSMFSSDTIPGDVHNQPRVTAYFPSCEDDGVSECVENVLQ